MSLLTSALIAPFSQVGAMAARQGRNAAATAGACHCFSLHWLSLILTNVNGSAKDRMSAVGADSGGSNPIFQKVFVTRWGTDGATDADFLITRNYKLKTADVIPYSAFNVPAVSSKVNAGVGSGFIYSFWFTGSVVGAEGGAHTIAFYANKAGGSTVVNLFDPNFGEFLVTIAEFSLLMGELMTRYGPGKNQILRSAVSG
jgi:hypothetical protein